MYIYALTLEAAAPGVFIVWLQAWFQSKEHWLYRPIFNINVMHLLSSL